MNKRIFFFDIDGTLIVHSNNEYIVLDSTKEALNRLRENKHEVFICSGRPAKFIIQEFKGMIDGYIGCNGTFIVYKNRCIYNRLIDVETIEFLKEEFLKLDMGVSFSGAYNGYAYNMDKATVCQMNRFYKNEEPYILENWNLKEIKANNIDVFFKNREHLRKCVEYFQDKLIFNTHEPHLSADVSFKDWDKAKGIEYLVKYIKRDMKDTVAFGDGKNDVTMLKKVDLGIAMGNAVEEVKKEADMVTDSADKDGIYNALNNLGFI
ncbi:Cof-type HAD-IIB family hydrolase [Clostridium felsineum]|uniref:Phosphatase n=1 Tax=Clostridium felsineum TaxID=36839 RepID=A0A1S8LBS5_9CLOT|nr:Cof-type HAD-IIB family hydrolase [Clostridium felsineum]MCR3761242.1 Cof-type HAD-IIB family hydrolase [Clostridium felsineum]URZ00043.1 Putative phosphatase [Clostridium felsineum]URZ07312.1 Putative phosphatase [Clostridium felsineum]URZ12343.1 Putative phosphatase [Clostridium felsineum]URZ17005.1 Putative phosphatase [Clostridium felsineum DSM 794]